MSRVVENFPNSKERCTGLRSDLFPASRSRALSILFALPRVETSNIEQFNEAYAVTIKRSYFRAFVVRNSRERQAVVRYCRR